MIIMHCPATLFCCNISFHDFRPRELVKKVAVIGAGIAGIGAALTFIANGCDDIVILEAQDRAGGRIRSINHEHGILDLGAQWLHGKSNHLYEAAEENDLIADQRSEEGLGRYVRDDGLIFDAAFLEKVNFEIGRILYECEKYDGRGDLPTSVGEYLERGFEMYLDKSEDSDEVEDMKRQLLEWNVRFQVADNSCLSLNELSARGWGKYVCLDEEMHVNLKRSFGSIVDSLLKKIPKNIILLNAAVSQINYENVASSNHVILSCENGLTVLAEHVILTPSLGVLKEFTNIKPSLPSGISEAINCLGFHGVGKIFLVFDEIWWDCEGFQLLWRRNVNIPKEEEWSKYIIGFDTVFNNPHVLVGWIGGKYVEVMESLTEEQVSTHCVKLLRRFLPNYEIPDPINVYRTKWLSNPYIRGGYSHIAIPCDRLGSATNQLSEPVRVDGVPRILLAGEAVHPTFFFTAHGAYESGQSQAEKLCQYFAESDGRHSVMAKGEGFR